ncbi:MAG: DUF6448 family protein [Bacteroidota bacterium]
MSRMAPRFLLLLLPALLLWVAPRPALAHCDGLDGPVVTAARQALDTGNPNLVLIWVQPKDEAEVRTAFDRARKLRKLGPEAKDLADTWFFETIVRVHRAGEGAPYTGLKPAGRDLGPAIPAADKALTSGDVAPLVTLLTTATGDGLREQFEKVRSLKGYDAKDLEAGRRYVAAYVTYIHYAERLYGATAHPTHGHFGDEAETAAPAPHEESD